MRVMLIGSNGQLGTDLSSILLQGAVGEDDFLPLRHLDMDVCDPNAIEDRMSRFQPDVVISTAAYHRVDECERETQQAFMVNVVATRYLAEACARHGATLAWFSTDFVFNGRTSRPYVEDDPVAPLSVYGCSKVAGEMVIRATLDKHFIVRTSSLFGVAGSSGKGGNFVETIRTRLGRGDELKVVDDLEMSPTYTMDLAQAVLETVSSQPYGTYHITNSGSCTWYDFACDIARRIGFDPAAVGRQSASALSGARRPAYSVLGSSKRASLRPWQEALLAYLEER
ncbi:MAG: rfbD [Dehalococcoidia bacterium]|nr:rfbD [Dehalococcoidia bacterium]